MDHFLLLSMVRVSVRLKRRRCKTVHNSLKDISSNQFRKRANDVQPREMHTKVNAQII